MNDWRGVSKQEWMERAIAAEKRAETAAQWQTQVPWSALRMVLDAAYQFAEGNYELWADCEQVQTWVDDHEIGDESCATIHPETWEQRKQYAEYCATVASQGYAPETFENWRNGASTELNPYVTHFRA